MTTCEVILALSLALYYLSIFFVCVCVSSRKKVLLVALSVTGTIKIVVLSTLKHCLCLSAVTFCQCNSMATKQEIQEMVEDQV